MLGLRYTRLILATLLAVVGCVAAGVAGDAPTSVSLQFPDGQVHSLELQMLEPLGGTAPEPYIPLSRFVALFQNNGMPINWSWDTRTGLLRLETGAFRYSLSSTRPILIVNDRLINVAYPIRFTEGETWIPMGTFRYLIGALDGVRLTESSRFTMGNTLPTTTSIISTPEQALERAILPRGPSGEVDPLLNVPPMESGDLRVIFDPALVDAAEVPGGDLASIRSALVQIAGRCSELLRQEGSLQPLMVTEHSNATSPDLILELVSRHDPQLVVYLRLEVSPLRQTPGCMIYYPEESVDAQAFAVRPDTVDAPTRRDLKYLEYQRQSRRLAEALGDELGDPDDRLPDIGYPQVFPMPMYLLKRSPTPSVMIVLSYPEGSSVLRKLGDSGVRESIARKIVGGLLEYRKQIVVQNPGPESSGIAGL